MLYLFINWVYILQVHLEILSAIAKMNKKVFNAINISDYANSEPFQPAMALQCHTK